MTVSVRQVALQGLSPGTIPSFSSVQGFYLEAEGVARGTGAYFSGSAMLVAVAGKVAVAQSLAASQAALHDAFGLRVAPGGQGLCPSAAASALGLATVPGQMGDLIIIEYSWSACSVRRL